MRKTPCLVYILLVVTLFMTSCNDKNTTTDSSFSDTMQSSKESEVFQTEVQEIEEYEDKLNIDSENTNYEEQSADDNIVLDWSGITANGVDEELFLEKLDLKALETVATELQTLVQEEVEEERANPNIVLTEGWTRVFDDEHYKNVLAMGDSAMMPLYWIIYKSPDAGMYEYICATALYELSGYDFSNDDGSLKWNTSKEFLELFNEAKLNDRMK